MNSELAVQKKSDESRSSVSVDVFARYLKECRNHQNATSNWLKRQGLSWSFGQVLIPNNKIAEVVAYLEDQRVHNERLFSRFIENLPANMKDDDRAGRLGDLFDATDYKTVARLKSQWKFDVIRDTVPDPESDIRAGWSVTQMDDMRRVLEEQESVNVKAATIELLERLAKPLKNVFDKMSRYDGGKDGRFNNKSFINNVRDVVDTMVANNLRDDPELEGIRRQVIADICQLNPEDLREDADLREHTKKNTASILERMGDFGSSL